MQTKLKLVAPACDHPEGEGHDCAYVNWRNSLVPTAIKVADAAHPKPLDFAEIRAWSWRWDEAYHRAMANLTSPAFVPAQEQEVHPNQLDMSEMN